MTYIKNQPNAAKLISSLRNTGYDSYAAIEDILDNSIDAGARTIKLEIKTQDKEPLITISDDGTGMDYDILDQALKLGSETQKDEVSDLGRYGMGLCTASISLAKKLEVFTKTTKGKAYYSSQDLDDVIKENEFIKDLREMNKKEEGELKKAIGGESGTVIVLSKIDRLSNSNLSIFSSTISKEIGRIFRKFIESGIVFMVNGNKVLPHDPLMADDKNTKI